MTLELSTSVRATETISPSAIEGFAIEASMPVMGEAPAPGRLHTLAVLAGAGLVIAVYVWLPLVLFARIVLVHLVPAMLGASGGVLLIAAVIVGILQATSAGRSIKARSTHRRKA